jgi:hypothetical protein
MAEKLEAAIKALDGWRWFGICKTGKCYNRNGI